MKKPQQKLKDRFVASQKPTITSLPSRSRKIKFHVGSLVVIEWVDSAFEPGWRYSKEPKPLQRIKTVGYVSSVSHGYVEISSTIGVTGGVLNALAIPIGCILEWDPI